MNRILLFIALLLAPTVAFAQKVYKCTSSTGVVVFSHDPCGADAKVIDTTRGNQHSEPHDRTDIINGNKLDDMDHDCDRRVNAIAANSNVQIRKVGERIASLRADMGASANNLAGAQRNTGIQTEIAGLEGRLSAMETTRDSSIASAQNECLAAKDAEIQRQAAQKQKVQN